MTQRAPDPSPDDLLSTGEVTLTLTNAEALVLSDYLARAQKSDPERYQPQYQAEQRVLWDLNAMLESQLVELINNPRYEETVAFARSLVADNELDAHD